jgi:hydrogenase-4 component B
MKALIISALLLPLLATGFVLSPVSRTAALRCAPLASIPALMLALTAPVGIQVDLPWLLLGTRFGLDETGRMFLLFTSFVWLISGWFAQGYLHDDPRRHWFWAFFLATQAGNFGLCIAQDAASFYLLFTLMTFAAYGLVVHTATPEAFRAGRLYLIMAVLGEAALVAGVLLAVHAADSHFLAALATAPVSGIAAALLLGGFGVKAGLPLLHLWLPLAHPVAPIPASAVLSGVMLKAGVLGWIRFLPLGSMAMPEAGNIMMILGLLAMFFGVAIGIVQSNVKVLLAYSSISQMGFLALGVGAGLVAPDQWPALLPAIALYALHHALAKSALFLGSGVAKTWPGNRLVLIGLALPALALSGMTFTSGALVKVGLKYALADIPAPWPNALNWLLPLAALGTVLLLTRFMILAANRSTEENHQGMIVPWTILLVAVLTSSWWLAPDGTAAKVTGWDAMLASAWPVLAALSIYAIARRPAWRPPSIPPGDVVVPLERAVAAMIRIRISSPALPPLPAYFSGEQKIWSRLENAMQNWTVAGILWLLLLLVLGLLFAGLRG